MSRAVSIVLALAVVFPAGAQPASPPTVGEVALVRNQVLGVPPNGVAGLLAVGNPLLSRHRVDTLADSAARLKLGDNASLSLGAQTSITLDEITLQKAGAGQSRLSLLLGQVRVQLNRLFGGLEVDTPSAVIGIKGTVLDIHATATFTRVTVLEGLVTVTSRAFPKKPVEVKAGQQTEVVAGKEPTKPEPIQGPAPPDPAQDPIPPPSPPAAPPTPPPSTPPPSTPHQTPPEPTGPATITGCSQRGQAGQSVCVCGNFPGQTARALEADGRALTVTASGPGRAQVLLPRSLPPGKLVISGDRAAGFARGQRCTVDVWVLETELKDLIRQGRSTELTVRALGTRDKVRVRVENLSPEIVRLNGGNEQVVKTNGGGDNSVEIDVETLRPGTANISVVLEGLADCPCGGGRKR